MATEPINRISFTFLEKNINMIRQISVFVLAGT